MPPAMVDVMTRPSSRAPTNSKTMAIWRVEGEGGRSISPRERPFLAPGCHRHPGGDQPPKCWRVKRASERGSGRGSARGSGRGSSCGSGRGSARGSGRGSVGGSPWALATAAAARRRPAPAACRAPHSPHQHGLEQRQRLGADRSGKRIGDVVGTWAGRRRSRWPGPGRPITKGSVVRSRGRRVGRRACPACGAGDAGAGGQKCQRCPKPAILLA